MEIQVSPQRLFVEDYAVVLLNRKIKLHQEFFVKIWNNAKIRHVIDGGANCFFHFLKDLPDEIKNTVKFPDLASGDFDSITEESMNLLKSTANTNCKIIETEDQDETDFTKGLAVLRDHIINPPANEESTVVVKNVICICEFGGRLDQTLGNLNTLHKNVFLHAGQAEERRNVFLMSSETLSWLLPANCRNKICFETQPPSLVCGVIPLVGPTRYTTTGLKWNMTTNTVCKFGGLVSTSNQVVDKVVNIVSVENHSVFSVELMTDKYVL